MSRLEINIDKNANMLIIGAAATSVSLREISYETNFTEVYRKYGDSDITKAFKIAQLYGCKNIFVMNLRNSYDYLEATEVLKDHDFAYIVPVSVYMSDTLNDPNNNNAKYSYISYLLSMISHNPFYCNSTIVATDKHASLYENMDDYIEDMNFAQSYVIDGSTNRNIRENVIFVANNLKDTIYANVVLAASLCSSGLAEYPLQDFGNAIFDIDQWDGIDSWAYFKNHVSSPTSVENLLNLSDKGPTKIVFISRIIKALKRGIDFNEFIGRNYTEYQRTRIQDKLASYLSDAVGVLIYDFDIKKVVAVKSKSAPNTVKVYCVFSVWPIGCLEECHIAKEVIL